MWHRTFIQNEKKSAKVYQINKEAQKTKLDCSWH